MFTQLIVAGAFVPLLAFAQLTPTAPGPGDQFTAGGNCTIEWTADETGAYLMSGPNNNMSFVTNVTTGLDGTDPSLTPFTWTCPFVTPNSDIYSYKVCANDSDTTWTSRFSIAAEDGSTTPPEYSTQPNGDPIPWGYGSLSNQTQPQTDESEPDPSANNPDPSSSMNNWPETSSSPPLYGTYGSSTAAANSTATLKLPKAFATMSASGLNSTSPASSTPTGSRSVAPSLAAISGAPALQIPFGVLSFFFLAGTILAL
ncbi:hypothetical protein SISSUDRAFT_988523 [Sistotremastrum suecicum HHB10207 ss-3]|uniref:Yeast cell wall synthesis Kre9/Knh1-like N-terminal domain-containing protein n=1 Tax=Sistotremastrum suecicum HHB10207 ss-3 TaxID=1314776 RepID=A0A166BWU4_9AGAM|nr:hypothetical protein SISSUDRAFT_988523 [Sistotremastrum suecicum HHB10207 ss-3]